MKNILIISGFIFIATLIFFGGKLSASGLINVHLVSNFLDLDIIRNNYLIFQGVIAVLIVIVFTYSGKLFYEWMDKKE
jgi:amino acid permease